MKITQHDALTLLTPGAEVSSLPQEKLLALGFQNPLQVIERLRSLVNSDNERHLLSLILPGLLISLEETPDAERSVVNFERFARAVPARQQLFEFLASEPRSIEILLRLFVGSQFLTEILVRQPDALLRLTQHKRVSEFKSREEFTSEGRKGTEQCTSLPELMTTLRNFQQWEILRIAACDTFGLMDLKTVTRQLALLADSVVQLTLEGLARIEGRQIGDIAVIAFGKLGGLELNYSSDIDLVFVCESRPEQHWPLVQKFIKVVSEYTDLGFLYRVDMRLRPWGHSGPLVTTREAYLEYLKRDGRLWEHQALLKARAIAGNLRFGERLLDELSQITPVFEGEVLRASVREMKAQIEQRNARHGKHFGEVKTGPGGIRDIEFLVQFLQLAHIRNDPRLRTTGTLEGLIRLSEADLIHAQDYRTLSSAYVILRTIEHSLQLMHNQQAHTLPSSDRELAYLARRLDFSSTTQFLTLYRELTHAVAEIFHRHLSVETTCPETMSEEPEHRPKSSEEAPILDSRTFGRLLQKVTAESPMAMDVLPQSAGIDRVAIIGSDLHAILPAVCGLLFRNGFEILSADVVPVSEFAGELTSSLSRSEWSTATHGFVGCFHVQSVSKVAATDQQLRWERFRREAEEFSLNLSNQEHSEAQALLTRKLGQISDSQASERRNQLLPVSIEFDKLPVTDSWRIRVRAEDVPGFLYELIRSVIACRLSIDRMIVRTENRQVLDTFYVTDASGTNQFDEDRQNQLRAAIVLTKHFTHLLPQAPNPEAALTHFRDLLNNLFDQPDWLNQLKTLENPRVLSAMAHLLGVSDFLWQDFLRVQYENLFPVVTDITALQVPYDRRDLEIELNHFLADAEPEDHIAVLNRFKDRAMMRVDMRHILGLQSRFGMFSLELTDVAETVVNAAINLCQSTLQAKYGIPRKSDGQPVRFAICALGKCGGMELGYASDIELMFLYDDDGETDGQVRITAADFFQKLIRSFRKAIHSRHRRIFEIDLRLRPYGNAGSLAVSRESFRAYFSPHGPAWPYERQALVKLRPIGGDLELGRQLVRLRDELVYINEPFDISAMRALREKQVRQHVQPGTFHAKLSPGGLVDCEYFVQGLQMTFGHLSPEIRDPNTRAAMKGLQQAGVLTEIERLKLRDAYRFLRRVIDAMRIVRGDASDLTIPEPGTDQFEFLARRLQMSPVQLHHEIEQNTCQVVDMVSSFEEFISRTFAAAEPHEL